MSVLEQVLVVIAALALMPYVVKLLWKLYLIPVAVYFVCTRLVWPAWAAAHKELAVCLFAASVLTFAGAWALKLMQYRREKRDEEAQILTSLGYDPKEYKIV